MDDRRIERSTIIKSIIYAVIAIGIFCMFATGYVRAVNSTILAETHTYLTEVTKQGAAIVNTQVAGDLKNLEAIATITMHKTDYQFEDILKVLQEEVDKKRFKRMGIILPTGRVYTSDGLEGNFYNKEYFQKAMQGETNISETLTDNFDGEKIMVCATPIYRRKEIRGVLFATHSIQIYQSLLSFNAFSGQGYSYIIKSDGTFVIDSDYPQSNETSTNIFKMIEGMKVKDKKQLEAMKENLKVGKSGYIEYSWNGVKNYMNYEQLGVNDWYITSVVPSSTITNKSAYLIKLTFIVTLSGASLFILLILYILYNQSKTKKMLENIAFVDSLTGIATATKFKLDCEKILSRKSEYTYAIVVLDVDKFKILNDLYGRGKGDRLLKYIATVLSKNMGVEEAYSRIGADNFQLLMRYREISEITRRLKRVERKIQSFETNYNITLSMGIYRIEDNERDIHLLVDRADIARKTLKSNREGSYAFYTEEIRNVIVEEKEIENQMLPAYKNGEFIFYLQPKYNIHSNQIVGAEALVRWTKPNGRVIAPNQFIPILEKNGFVVEIDKLVLEKVCEMLQSWKEKNKKVLPVSVNLSRVHFHSRGFVDDLCEIVGKYPAIKELIEFEITENVILDYDNKQEFIKIVDKIKEYGFKVDMDDFGTGYSSLNLLREMSVDVIKLDKGFFDTKGGGERGNSVVKHVISMAKELDIEVVAEGVETEQQIEFLKEVGCDIVQGYYFSEPIPVSQFEELFFES